MRIETQSTEDTVANSEQKTLTIETLTFKNVFKFLYLRSREKSRTCWSTPRSVGGSAREQGSPPRVGKPANSHHYAFEGTHQPEAGARARGAVTQGRYSNHQHSATHDLIGLESMLDN